MWSLSKIRTRLEESCNSIEGNFDNFVSFTSVYFIIMPMALLVYFHSHSTITFPVMNFHNGGYFFDNLYRKPISPLQLTEEAIIVLLNRELSKLVLLTWMCMHLLEDHTTSEDSQQSKFLEVIKIHLEITKVSLGLNSFLMILEEVKLYLKCISADADLV